MCYIPKRCIFTALAFLGILVIYAARINLSVAIVAMVNSTTVISLNKTYTVAAYPNLRPIETLPEENLKGLTFPAITNAISKWSPEFERSRMSTVICLGIPIGNIIGSPLSGFLSSLDLFGGWPLTFYLFGTFGCVWFLFWCLFAHEIPGSHPYISKSELQHIEQNKSEKAPKKVSVPWKDIFLSSPMWAVIIAHFGHDWAFIMFLTMMPTYFKTIHHFDIKKNGFFSALPYAVHGLSSLLASYCADKLRQSNKLNITAIRKIFNTIGTIGPALCCLGIIAASCQAELILALICLCMFLNGFANSGFHVTHIDMSPDHSGVLYGISNSIANISGIFSPIIVGIVTANGDTVGNWNTIFCITSAIYTVCGLFYAIFASAEVQPWG